MAQFDPLQKFETWIFQKVGVRQTASGERPIYRRLGWNRVEYDGSPNQFIEPVTQPRPEGNAVQLDNYGGQVIGWETVEGKQLPAFALGEVVDTKGPSPA